jgi:hypothetical protein
MRFPARADLPLQIVLNGVTSSRDLALETTETIRVPLSSTEPAQLSLLAPRNFPLTAPDPRARSFRIVNIDFE